MWHFPWSAIPVFAPYRAFPGRSFNTLRPRPNGRHFADDIFKWIFLNENVWIPIKISLKFVPQGPINNIPALVHIMAWHLPGDKPLSEPMMVSLPTYICVTRPQWVLTHWGLVTFWKVFIQTHFHHWFTAEVASRWYHKGEYWWEVNIGSGNGLVPAGSKPLPDLNQVHDAIWHHYASDELIYITQCRHYNCRWPGIFSTRPTVSAFQYFRWCAVTKPIVSHFLRRIYSLSKEEAL